MYAAIQQDLGCIDTSRLGEEEKALAMGDFKKFLQTSVGRHLMSELLEDPQGDRVIFEALAPGGAPSTASLDVAKSTRKDPDDALPGASTFVRYHPGQSEDFGGQGDAPDWYPIPSDVVLFHELVHAHHHQDGTAQYTEPADGKRANFDEENLTTGTDPALEAYFNENRYRAERRRLGAHLPNRDRY